MNYFPFKTYAVILYVQTLAIMRFSTKYFTIGALELVTLQINKDKWDKKPWLAPLVIILLFPIANLHHI